MVTEVFFSGDGLFNGISISFQWHLVSLLTIHKCWALELMNRKSQLGSNQAPPLPVTEELVETEKTK